MPYGMQDTNPRSRHDEYDANKSDKSAKKTKPINMKEKVDLVTRQIIPICFIFTVDL